MEMVAGGKSGRADLAQDVTGLYFLANDGVDGREMVIAGIYSQAVVDDNRTAPHIEWLRENDGSGGRRENRRSGVSAIIDSFVIR
jgi:hypothetical protein